MYKGQRIILIAPAYNEEQKIGEVVRRVPREIVDSVLVIDDGSTDRTAEVAARQGAKVIELGRVCGVGAAIRHGYQYAQQCSYDIVVTIAGNNKDSPEEISRLLDPICDKGYDFVMGSRYLPGGFSGGEIPLYRRLSTRLHPLVVSMVSGRQVTESTNGYRAVKTSVLSDPRINLQQGWLDHYELEVYLLMKLLSLDFKCTEVPVSKIYPPRRIGNTKMRPVLDWWKMIKPILLLGLSLRH
jgi:dolichol-phosphate mannosyltransferase